MAAAKYDLQIDQGSNLSLAFHIPVNELSLSGYTARAQVRSTHSSSSTVLDFSTVTTPIAVTSSSSANKIALVLTASETAALTAGRYVWDLEIVSGGGVVTRLLEGSCVVTPEVTR